MTLEPGLDCYLHLSIFDLHMFFTTWASIIQWSSLFGLLRNVERQDEASSDFMHHDVHLQQSLMRCLLSHNSKAEPLTIYLEMAHFHYGGYGSPHEFRHVLYRGMRVFGLGYHYAIKVIIL